MGSPVYLFDVTPSGSMCVYAGKVNARTVKCVDRAGNLRISVQAVSLESVFDSVLVRSRLYQNVTCGFIFSDLLSLAAGSPVTPGEIDAGMTLAQFVVSGLPKIADLFDQLATLSLFVWGVDPSTQEVFFHAPDAEPAPFELQTSDLQFASFDVKSELKDYRNQQVIQTSYDAFAHSSELFSNSDMQVLPQGQSSFKLKRPVNQVTNAWFTYNTQNTAVGTFTGQPSVGDTILISFPTFGSSSIYTWHPSVCPSAPSTYALGQIIIDSNGHVQKCTQAGTAKQLADAPAGPPAFSTDGGFVTDGPPLGGCSGVTSGVVWTDQGIQGFAGGTAFPYTFVSALDNTQWGQVLIGATLAATIQNFVDAVNALDTTNAGGGGSPTRGRGVTFSWPTWENPLVNADTYMGGSTTTVRNKSAGSGYVAGLAYTPVGSSMFSWAHNVTSGGSTKFNTTVCPVGLYNSLATSGLAYQPGSDVVSLSFPLGIAPNVGVMLQVEYTRADGDSITVENSAQVAIRAAVEHGTGMYQQRMTADSAWTNIQALQQVQNVLAAYCVLPDTFMFVTLRPGLYAGMLMTAVLATPAGFASLVNGAWCVQEINAEWIVRKPYIDPAFAPPGSEYGHFRYTTRVVDAAQIGDFVDFWRGLAGKGGGGSAVVVGGSQPSGALAPLNPGQVFAVEQSQIAGLSLTAADDPTLVIVKDYSHSLIWTGASFQFADEGSNWYAFSDHAPSPGSPAIENGWAPCDGSTVNYLKGDGTLGTKTLPNLLGGSHFLELGNYSGDTVTEVPGVVTSISGTIGTCTITALTGGVGIDAVTVDGDVSGSVTVYTGNAYRTDNWYPPFSVGLAGTATLSGHTDDASYSTSPTISGNTGFSNANLDSATFTVGGSVGGITGSADWLASDYTDNASVGGTTDPSGSISLSFAGTTGTWAGLAAGFDVPGTSDVDSTLGSAFSITPGLNFSTSVSFSGPTTIAVDTSGLSVGAGSLTVGGPVSGQAAHDHPTGGTINVGHHTHALSGGSATAAVDTSGLGINAGPGSPIEHAHGLIEYVATSGEGDVDLMWTQTFGGGLAHFTFISGSGTIATTGGTIGSTLGAKPAAVRMQAWFRL